MVSVGCGESESVREIDKRCRKEDGRVKIPRNVCFIVPTIGPAGLSFIWKCLDDHETIRDLPDIRRVVDGMNVTEPDCC